MHEDLAAEVKTRYAGRWDRRRGGNRGSDGMSLIDIGFGVLAGVLSCLTPEAFLLCPLLLAAAGADDRPGLVALAVGLGLSLVLTGILAGTLGAAFGFEAVWLRRIACVLLLLQGMVLMSEALVARLPALTGGVDGGFFMPGMGPYGGAFRLLLLALLVGANWIPRVGETLGNATLMAADARDFGLALEILFGFGIGAALPWIVVGRAVRFLIPGGARSLLVGMGGKRLLGVALLVVGMLGISELDITVVHWINPMLPDWVSKLALEF
jgi:cytochrome c-type biogenesis protein